MSNTMNASYSLLVALMAQAANAVPIIVYNITNYNELYDTASMTLYSDPVDPADEVVYSMIEGADPTQGMPVMMPAEEISVGCCKIFSLAYYQGKEQELCGD